MDTLLDNKLKGISKEMKASMLRQVGWNYKICWLVAREAEILASSRRLDLTRVPWRYHRYRGYEPNRQQSDEVRRLWNGLIDPRKREDPIFMDQLAQNIMAKLRRELEAGSGAMQEENKGKTKHTIEDDIGEQGYLTQQDS